MKTLLIILFILFFVSIAHADWLACDVQQGITASEIQITPYGGATSTVPGVVIVEGNNLKVLDVSTFASGRYIFKVRLKGANDWWGDWSDPFDATKPAKGGGVRIVQ